MSAAKVCMIIVVLFAGNSVYAQHMNAKDAPCRGPESTADEVACFDSALKKSDLALNQLYRQIRTVVDGDELVKLKRAQQLWLDFRDANCDAEYELYGGGSAGPTAKLACLEAVTRHRTEELKVMYGWRMEKWTK